MKPKRRKYRKKYAGFKSAILLIAVAVMLPLSSLSQIVDFGTHGDIWDITESDPVAGIQSAYEAQKVEIQRKIDAVKDLKRYEPDIPTVQLETAKKRTSYLVDLTFTLENDIRDKDGKLIYPAGTQYNILDYPPFPTKRKYVFFDGANPEQVESVLSMFSDDSSVVYITGGSMAAWMAAKDKIGSGLKILTEDLAETLHIRYSISVAYQQDRNFRVDVIPPPINSTDARQQTQ